MWRWRSASRPETGIPYLLIDGRFDHTVESLMLLGAALGVADRAKMLAANVQAIFDRIDGALRAVPESKRPRVYLARRDDGLQTSYRGALNTEIIERAGGINVVDTGQLQGGLVSVSLEQVLTWNPDTVITADPKFAEPCADAGRLAQCRRRAEEARVLEPAPAVRLDRRAAVAQSRHRARIVGRLFFFPNQLNGDMRAETRAFYKSFYQVELSDAKLDGLFAGAPAAP